jgi:hypothetical protein
MGALTSRRLGPSPRCRRPTTGHHTTQPGIEYTYIATNFMPRPLGHKLQASGVPCTSRRFRLASKPARPEPGDANGASTPGSTKPSWPTAVEPAGSVSALASSVSPTCGMTLPIWSPPASRAPRRVVSSRMNAGSTIARIAGGVRKRVAAARKPATWWSAQFRNRGLETLRLRLERSRASLI